MKIRILLLLLLLAAANVEAQEKPLSLQEAIELAITQSDDAQLAETKVQSAATELEVTRNNRYPDLTVSGQYSYLTGADVELKIPVPGQSQEEAKDGGASPEVNQLLLGQANLSMPLFTGFKIKNAVRAGENLLKAAEYNALSEKEKIALQVIQNYLDLYKAEKAVALLEESLKTAGQRVEDFSAMEQNGLLARNDLLKAQLQQSRVELSLQEAQKNVEILNYRLSTALNLQEGTRIKISEEDIAFLPQQISEENKQTLRNDLQALEFQEKAAEDRIKIEKGDYYPSLALVGGYLALDAKNALTISNAMNIGVGVSYNLAGIFKNKSDVKLAESRAEELEKTIDLATDQIKVQVKNAEQEFQLALKKLDVFERSVVQATENYRIVKDKYDNGLASTNDLLEADVEQLQTRLELAYAKAGVLEKHYALKSAEGNLINNFISK